MSLAKRVLPIVFVVALTLGLAPQALAVPQAALTPAAAAGSQAFTCLGKVTAVAPSAGTVTVTVRRASLALQGSLGRSLTLSVTNASALVAISHGARTPTTLAGLPVGDLLTVSGTIAATTPAAPVYDIGKACAWRPSYAATFLCQGTVSSVDLQAGALVVQVGRGSSGLCGAVGAGVTVDVPVGAKIFALQGRLATTTTIEGVTAGDHIYVAGHADCVNPSVTMFNADLALVRHVVSVGQVTWFACCGQVGTVDQDAGTLAVAVTRGTLGVPGGSLTLTMTAGSIMRTLSGGVLTTVALAGVSPGEAIVVTGTIDRSHPDSPVYDIGQAFVW